MAWRQQGNKPLSGPMMVSLLTHICVSRPQWVNLREEFPRSIYNWSGSGDWMSVLVNWICLGSNLMAGHQGTLFCTLSKHRGLWMYLVLGHIPHNLYNTLLSYVVLRVWISVCSRYNAQFLIPQGIDIGIGASAWLTRSYMFPKPCSRVS